MHTALILSIPFAIIVFVNRLPAMLSKSFISIYVTEDSIQLVELNDSKKKASRYSTFELPDQLIKNNKIEDCLTFSKILKEVWKKLKINEKFISLIIPEYSSLIKILDLPNVNMSEIAEAVTWQLQELLPQPIEEYVMDWKILIKNEKGYQILAVAIERDVLGTYLTSCEGAGLYPVVVGIPSVSLINLIENKSSSCLFAYIGESETIFVVSQNEVILGSSVVGNSDIGELLKTAKMMIAHYKQTNVSKIVLGGKVNPQISEELNKALQLPVEVLPKSISNMSQEDFQKYLIPLSSQLQDPDIPADPFSLNLLPSDLIKEYKNAKVRLQTWSLTLASSLFVWISLIVSLASYFFMNQQINLQKQKLGQIPQSILKMSDVIQDIKNANEMSGKILAVKKVSFSSTGLVNKIYNSKPQEVVINMYDIDLDKGTGEIEGIAQNRQSLVTFRENLEKNTDIGNIEIPISNFESGSNLEFIMKFNYLPALVKENAAVKKGVIDGN